LRQSVDDLPFRLMMVLFTKTALLATLLASVVAADAPTCNPGQKCPTDTPCCSQYGQCGVGAYCLGGCDPISSNSLSSCVPEPVCQSKSYTWNDLSDVQPNTKYLGNASAADWVSSGQPLTSGGNLLLTMAPKTVGTLLASNHLVWYGKISAKLKTSRGQGVVTAFILLSDVKDEIDWEFIGADLQVGQTNFYSQGVLNYGNEVNASVSDTFDNWHTYEIDWNPDTVTWTIDGNSVRTLKRSDTWNATANRYDYPQTPSRVQLSLWPAGLPTNGEGTIAWAGGVIDWDSEDIKKNGYYYATFGEVDIKCYDPPSGANVQGSNSYVFTDVAATNNTVEITNNSTVLESFLGTGTNMTAGAVSSASGTAVSAAASDSIPGQNGGSGSGGSAQSNPNFNSSSSSSTNGGSNSSSTGFSQGGTSTTKSGASSQSERVLQGSLFAVLVAVVALVAM